MRFYEKYPKNVIPFTDRRMSSVWEPISETIWLPIAHCSVEGIKLLNTIFQLAPSIQF